MNAYLFAASVTRWQVIPVAGPGPGRSGTTKQLRESEGCETAIVYGDDPGAAQKRFKAWLLAAYESEQSNQPNILRVVAAQIVDRLFTESGSAPLDWPKIYGELQSLLQATATDDFEQGYWADVNELIRPEKLSASIESLKQTLPEDISSGLNWSPDKQWFFLLSVFSLPPPPPDPDAGLETGDAALGQPDTERSGAPDSEETVYPQLADKEAAAVIRARNSIVAAWLWRQFAADTRLAHNAIRIDPLCWAVGLADDAEA